MNALTLVRFSKAVALTGAAALYVPLVCDWCVPGEGLHEAVKALGATPGVAHPPLWAALVRTIGRDVAGLGTLSMTAALLCVSLLLILADDIVSYAIRLAQNRVTKTDASFAGAKTAAVALPALAFAVTPGFLRAATHVDPLLPLILPPLAALTLVVRVLTTVDDDEWLVDRLKHGWPCLLTAVLLVGYSAWEVVHARRLVASAWPSFVFFSLVGLFPLLAFADLTRRWLLLEGRRRLWFFGGWALVVAATGVVAVLSLRDGRVAERVARQIVRRGADCRAIVTDGALDDLLVFLLPANQRIVSLARDYDPAYGRELSDWLRKEGHATDSDLVFAAELGPRALVSEWTTTDPKGAAKALLTPEAYFPTVEAWHEGLDALADARWNEPSGAYLRRLLGVCGNHLACQRIEKGDLDGAWKIFWEVLDRVDAKNYTVLVNLSGLVERGYASPTRSLERLKSLRDAVERTLKTPEHRRFAALSGGRLYVDPKVRALREAERQKALEKDEIPPQVRAFITTVSAAPQDEAAARRAREAIRKGIGQGLVRTDRIGDQLLTLDRVLEDWESAEKDSLAVLRFDRHHEMANSTMGMLAGSRGDYLRAERYLRRAQASETSQTADNTLNDLAFTLTRLGRPEEAEGLARRAVSSQPENWNFRETLALALIVGGKADEGERELAQAAALAEKAGKKPNAIARFALDRAWLLKTRGETDRLKIALRVLTERKDLTEPQKAELKELGR